jgi:hypothetical protein
MTIDSTWIASFKEEAPESFTDAIPFHAKAAFCDGQIRLMRGGTGAGVLTWDDYIWQQFHSHVSKFFSTHGVGTVILAFDDYAHVPEAKSMTQIKRRRHLPKIEFLEREPLPSVCPFGDRWDQCIANRTFKAKVIALVIERLQWLLKLKGEQSLIIDYAGHPVAYRTGPDGQMQSRVLDHLAPLGEADVKFTRYADIFRDLLVDSVDGDSIPIALLHYEACMRDLTHGSMEASDLEGVPPRICIFRMTTRTADDKPDPPAKRTKKNEPKQEVPQKESQPKKRRTFEYVNIPALHDAMRTVVSQCFGRAKIVSHSDQYMSLLLTLIGLTGTDFTRSLPQVSGKSVYAFLPDVIPAVTQCYDTESGQLDVRGAADLIVASIYSAKFHTHFPCPPTSLESALHTLRCSKLSDRTKESLPSARQVICSIRNVNWLMLYWRQAERAPDPFATSENLAIFGFVRKQGLPSFAD